MLPPLTKRFYLEECNLKKFVQMHNRISLRRAREMAQESSLMI